MTQTATNSLGDLEQVTPPPKLLFGWMIYKAASNAKSLENSM